MKIDISKLTLAQVLEIKERLQQEGLLTRRTQSIDHQAASWDWSKRNCELARLHGVHPTYVSMLRRYYAKGQRATKHWPGCKNWDWTKSNTEIARELKIPVQTVYTYRVKLNLPPAKTDGYTRRPPLLRKTSKSNQLTDYTKLDWSKTDIELSREVGCSRENIRLTRARLGLPKRLHWMVKFDKFCATFKGIEQLSLAEAQAVMPITYVTFTDYCLRAGIKIIRSAAGRASINPWPLMNWRLPSSVLDKIWKLPYNSTANHRAKFKLPKAGVHMRLPKSVGLPTTYQTMVEQEQAKALAYQQRTNGQSTPHQSRPVLLGHQQGTPVQQRKRSRQISQDHPHPQENAG